MLVKKKSRSCWFSCDVNYVGFDLTVCFGLNGQSFCILIINMFSNFKI